MFYQSKTFRLRPPTGDKVNNYFVIKMYGSPNSNVKFILKNKIPFLLLLDSVSVKGGKSTLFCSISDNLFIFFEIARN